MNIFPRSLCDTFSIILALAHIVVAYFDNCEHSLINLVDNVCPLMELQSAALRSDVDDTSDQRELSIFNIEEEPPLVQPVPPEEGPPKSFLPNNCDPESYNLEIYTDLKNSTYNGTVNIKIRITENTRTITLHSHGLNITSVQIGDYNIKGLVADSTGYYDMEYNLDKINQFIIAKVPGNKLVEGESVNVLIQFNGTLSNKPEGFYRKDVGAINGDMKSMAVTRFLPTYARQAFPCFDEPKFKSKFTLRLFFPEKNYFVLTNIPDVEHYEYENGFKLSFPSSPIFMSTYLIDYIIAEGHLLYTEIIPKEGSVIRVKIHSRLNSSTKFEWAGEYAKFMINRYGTYFDRAYALPRLDIVALPSLEYDVNWGLHYMRETSVVYSSALHSTLQKVRVATAIRCELAHSWLGNKMSINWWNDYWLQKGLAIYVAYQTWSSTYPNFRFKEQFQINLMQPLLAMDAVRQSRVAKNPNKIITTFEGIHSKKVAAILWMISDFVGNVTFQEGLKNYMNKFTTPMQTNDYPNLFSEIDIMLNSTKNVVSEIVDTYTKQQGYPLVSLEWQEEGDPDEIRLYQSRFAYNLKNMENRKKDSSPYGHKWTIPITYQTNIDPKPISIIFHHNMDYLPLPVSRSIKWIKLNINGGGFYRVNYVSIKFWDNLIENYHTFGERDRAHIIEEIFTAVKAGYLNYHYTVDLLTRMVREYEYAPLATLQVFIDELITFMGAEEVLKMKTALRSIVDAAFRRQNWESVDSYSFLFAKTEIIKFGHMVDHEDCKTMIYKVFSSWLKNLTENSTIMQEMRPLVYIYGAQNASETVWNTMFQRFLQENDPVFKMDILMGLASVSRTSLLTKLIYTIHNDNNTFGSEEYYNVLKQISKNPVGNYLVWDYVREHWRDIVDRFYANSIYLEKIIQKITRKFSTEAKFDEINEFFKKYPDVSSEAREEILEHVKNNVDWIKNRKKDVEFYYSR